MFVLSKAYHNVAVTVNYRFKAETDKWNTKIYVNRTALRKTAVRQGNKIDFHNGVKKHITYYFFLFLNTTYNTATAVNTPRVTNHATALSLIISVSSSLGG